MNIINEERITTIKIKRSEFIGHLHYAETVENARAYIASISKKHHNATHNCWAYVVGEKGEYAHSSDNGEPSGTAGKPILRMLQKYDLTHVACVVTRYYGGVKLGVRGLIEAYGEAAENSIREKDLTRLVKTFSYIIEVNYKDFDTLKYQLEKLSVSLGSAEYSDKVVVEATVEDKDVGELDVFLKEMERSGNLSFIPKE